MSKTQPSPQPKPVIPARQAEDLTPEEKIARGEEARRLLEHPLMKQAFANLRLNYFEAFCQVAPEDVHGRDQIYHAGRVLADVEAHLRVVMSQGQVTKAQIDKLSARGAGRAV